MVVLDTAIVNVALPVIQRALHFTSDDLQWIVTAYTLSFGGFLLLGGRVADLYGRKRAFLAGVTAFGAASLVTGLSDSSTVMIVARGVQGLAAAFMSPAALSILLVTFTEGNERNRALGVWSAVAAGGAAAGVMVGGILTQYVNWRWNFFVNVPVSLGVVWAAWRILPAHASESEHNDLDLVGAALVTTGLIELVYGITKAPLYGWRSHATLTYLVSAAVLLIGFVGNEARTKHPLVPLAIFRIRNLSGANLTQAPIIAGMFSMFFFLSLYMQNTLGFSPSRSGLAYLPVTIIIGVVATFVSRQVGRIGYKPMMVMAPLIMSAGLYLLQKIPVGGSYVHNVLPGLSLVAIGAGMSFVSVTIAATSGVPSQLSGLASGILNTSQQVGGALGLAILSGVAASAAASTLASAAGSPAALPQAAVDGYQAAFRVGMWFTIAASACALTVVRQRLGAVAASPAGAPTSSSAGGTKVEPAPVSLQG